MQAGSTYHCTVGVGVPVAAAVKVGVIAGRDGQLSSAGWS